MGKIKKVKARQILDSRGNPTVECDVITDKGLFRSAVPSGASAGSHEALELRDGEKAYGGKAVTKAVKNVNEIIAPKLVGKDVAQQKELDEIMLKLDGTESKNRLGANAILAASMSVCKAGAAEGGLPLYEYLGNLGGNKRFLLPVPQLNVINGGKHAGQENDIQEHMIAPVGAKSFSEAIQMAAETYHALGKILKKKFGARGILIGDEGGFVPDLKSVQERLDVMQQAIDEAGYSGKIYFALDSASSEFFNNGTYTIGGKKFSPAELVDFYKGLADSYKIYSMEDAMAEDDWQGWVELTKKIGGKVQIVGDDLLVTNPQRIKKAIELKAVNAVLIKPNQIGTVTETIDAIKITQKNGWNAVVSHRSGETEDSFIADLVVGMGCGQSKFGAPARSDRNAKYNQLLRIEEQLQETGDINPIP